MFSKAGKENKEVMQELQETMQEFNSRMEGMESSVGQCFAIIPEMLQQQHDTMQLLRSQMVDLEDRSNIRIRGIPEVDEGEKLRTVVQEILNKLLGKLEFKDMEIDRLHRIPGICKLNATYPRDVLCRIHFYSLKEKVMLKAQKYGRLDYEGAKIENVPDLSKRSASGIRRKGPQTPGDLLIYSLEDLYGRDFKRFKNKLSDFSYGDKCPIPRGRLENADWITTKDLLIDIYGERALDATIEVFTLIGLMGPAKDLQDRRAQNVTGDLSLRGGTTTDHLLINDSFLSQLLYVNKQDLVNDVTAGGGSAEYGLGGRRCVTSPAGRQSSTPIDGRPRAKLKKTTHDMRLSDFRKEYRESVEKMFQRINEYNSRMGEAVSLQKRYIKLLMRKGHKKKEEKEQEIRRIDRRHLQIMEGRSCDEYSPTTIQDLFAPNEDGFIPDIVVLQGPAGIGKTMTTKKIMLDWASGNLYQDNFNFVFYLSCRELNTITENINLVGLLSRSCRLQCSGDLMSILKDPRSHRKLLFLVDGFDELKWTLEEESEVCHNVFEETHKEILLQSLLRKQIVQQSSLIITTRSLAMKKLNKLIGDPRYVEIQGFTREDREEYVHKFFGNKEDADKALRTIRDNYILYTMCAVPITCWIVCTLIKQEIKKDLGLIRCKTMTSIYLLHLKVLLTHHSKKDQPVDGRPPAINTCLKKLCSLANEGVLNQQILFEEEDLQRHGLSLSEVESVFLNENIFHWDIHTQTCYSFIHLSVQEFLAALYYGLDGGSGTEERRKEPSCLKGSEGPFPICEGKSLTEFFIEHPHSGLAVKFLFGLLNEKMVKTFSEITDINISLPARSVIEEWAMEDIDKGIGIDGIVCLYETQDENFIRRIISQSSHLKVGHSLSNCLGRASNHAKQLDYCLKTLKRETYLFLHFEELTLDPACQKSLSLFVHRSRRVRFSHCTFQRWYGEDGESSSSGHDEESSSSGDDEESSSSGDEMVPDNLSFLMNLESKIQELRLERCGLTFSSCEVLRSILITNRSLIRLHLSHNNLQDSGIKLLCEGLQHPDCTLQELRVYECGVTFSCCDDLCCVITANRTLTSLYITMDGDKKMPDSEVTRCCELLQHAGFTVRRRVEEADF
ncbi:PREDICTED: NACHT, LRR and PYD domains-containing protein 3-like [Nanorana parkeri]|uniref:NACHT, LRR and PYD domains-containing protein 3-like n=1 Tax=Nanorana parkeri TaxID=125878 RepID=UPI000854C525|nr:PREDICTED: NACHT, LRR and PYD domains-containing protein 3-like [Nanorana parkeri]